MALLKRIAGGIEKGVSTVTRAATGETEKEREQRKAAEKQIREKARAAQFKAREKSEIRFAQQREKLRAENKFKQLKSPAQKQKFDVLGNQSTGMKSGKKKNMQDGGILGKLGELGI